MTENSHRQTLTIELDQNMDEFDQKYKNKINSKFIRRQTLTCEYDRKYLFSIFGHIHMLMFVIVVIFILF